METKKVKAIKEGDILYIKESRNKFLPSYVYYLLEHYDCNKVVFNASTRMYLKESLKGKEDWKDVEFK